MRYQLDESDERWESRLNTKRHLYQCFDRLEGGQRKNRKLRGRQAEGGYVAIGVGSEASVVATVGVGVANVSAAAEVGTAGLVGVGLGVN